VRECVKGLKEQTKETSNSKKSYDERKREKVTKRRQRERRKFDKTER
jgi:hypothetical protein